MLRQHSTPLFVSAQVCKEPVLIALAPPPERPLTATGTELFVVVPLPSWPSLLLPQHPALLRS